MLVCNFENYRALLCTFRIMYVSFLRYDMLYFGIAKYNEIKMKSWCRLENGKRFSPASQLIHSACSAIYFLTYPFLCIVNALYMQVSIPRFY